MTDEEAQAITDAAAAGPAKVATQAGTVEARTLEELIKFEQHVASRSARAFRIQRGTPPSAIGPPPTD